jgi:XTP/dITP diphosphohydrolase
MELLFVTGNEGKVREAREILSYKAVDVRQEKMDLDEVQDSDAETVSRHKAIQAYKKLRTPLIVEDTGLHIAAMNGYPGAMIKHFLESIGMRGIVDFVRGKSSAAEAVCVVSYCGEDGEVTSFRGSVRGRISSSVAGSYDFGWDPIFIPEGHERTFAEMGMDEKNKVSHRRMALEKLALWLKSNAV